MSTTRPLLIVAGIGNASVTVLEQLQRDRAFAKGGYRVALIARNMEHLNRLVEEICGAGGEAAAFPIPEYSYTATGDVFDKIISHAWPGGGSIELRVALWNVGVNVFGSFLNVTEKDIQSSLEVHVTAGFAFSRKVILAFKENELDSAGSRGTLLTMLISQVAHTIIDGSILTDLSLSRRGDAAEAWKANPALRLDAESIEKSYLYLVQQDRSAWTWELDLRPAHEKCRREVLLPGHRCPLFR